MMRRGGVLDVIETARPWTRRQDSGHPEVVRIATNLYAAVVILAQKTGIGPNGVLRASGDRLAKRTPCPESALPLALEYLRDARHVRDFNIGEVGKITIHLGSSLPFKFKPNMKRCSYCGKPIKRRRGDAKYCSDSHKTLSWKQRQGR